MDWVAVGAVAGPLMAGAAVVFASRDKKLDSLAVRTATLIAGQDRRIESLERQVAACDSLTAALRLELSALRVELVARKS